MGQPRTSTGPSGSSVSAPRGARVAVEDVTRVFEGGIVAVDGVSLTLAPGEFVALAGPSGSGKTTLLSIIGGLDEPSSGSVQVDGRPLAADVSFHRDVVGFIFQHHHLLLHLSAHANVEIPLIGAGVPAAERRERAHDLLSEVGLAGREDGLAVHLSGGERQRVAVARALANEPSLLLADEPTGALDSGDTRRIVELLQETRARRGMTTLVVTHNEALAREADRRLMMLDGRIDGESQRSS